MTLTYMVTLTFYPRSWNIVYTGQKKFCNISIDQVPQLCIHAILFRVIGNLFLFRIFVRSMLFFSFLNQLLTFINWKCEFFNFKNSRFLSIFVIILYFLAKLFIILDLNWLDRMHRLVTKDVHHFLYYCHQFCHFWGSFFMCGIFFLLWFN